MKGTVIPIILVLTLLLTSCSQPAVSPAPTAELTATGLTPEENVKRYSIPAIIVLFDYPVPDVMIEDLEEREGMIEAKIAHLREVNRLFWGDAPGTPEERQAVFDELWTTADSYFVAFNRLDTDWDSFYEAYHEKIGQVQSYGEYLSVITRMSYLLREAHTYMMPGRLSTAFLEKGLGDDIINGPVPGFIPAAFNSSIGACITVTSEEALVISRIWERSPNPYRLKVGDEIVGFDGVSWEEWIPRLEGADIPIWGSSDGAETARRYTLLRAAMQNAHLFEKMNIMRVDSGEIETVPIVFMKTEEDDARNADCSEWTETDGLVSVDNTGKTLSWQDDPMFVYGVIEAENIGYMYIKNLAPQDPAQFANQFEEAVLSLMGTEGLIIDLRGNGGGEFPSPLFQGLAHLVRGTEDRQFYALAVNDLTNDDRTSLVDIVEGWGEACQYAESDDRFDLQGLCEKSLESARNISSHPFRADDPDLYYLYAIVVLVGPGCGSACDHLVHLLSQFPEFTIIGRDPNGSLTFPKNWDRLYAYPQIKDGVMLKIPAVAPYAVDEETIDHLCRRTGLVDVEVWFTKEDVINGVDTVREYAIQLIREARSEGE
jgi:C-terminal processing protease CtpA/Prc